MIKQKTSLKYIRLTALFALCIFIILLATMLLGFGGTFLLEYMGVVSGENLNRLPLFLFCIASILIGTLLAVVFSKIPLRPLKEIMTATDNIADGNFNIRVSLKGPDEFRELGHKFNHMAEELESVEMLRTDFINNFSHEFKTPIVSVRGFAKALKSENLSETEKNEYLDIIISESERLVSLSTNILYLSKIESQTILSEKKHFNLSEQIRLVIALLDQKFAEKHLEIEFEGVEISFDGNGEMLRQVWINLLDNAIKFSPIRGKIEVCLKEQPDMISVKICDHGNGMCPEQQSHIFDKFYQCDNSHSTAGNGLGLTIVKKIVTLHGGKIVVRSSDKGSIFEVLLPNIHPRTRN